MPATTKQKQSPKADPRHALIDEYAALSAAAERWRPQEKRLKALRETMLGWFPKLKDGEAATVESAANAIDITARETERSVRNMKAVASFFGNRFFDLCSIPLKHLDSEMTEAQRAEHIDESQSGKRRFEVRSKVSHG